MTRRLRHLRVPVTEAEGRTIEQHAEASGLAIAAYLRVVGQGQAPRAVIDQQQVATLAKAMADLGRLGGLLKLWLSDDAKLAAYPPQQVARAIPETLQEIRRNQGALLEVIRKLDS